MNQTPNIVTPNHAERFIRWAWTEAEFSPPCADDLSRNVYHTVMPGCYSRPSGHVLVVEGTPPHATLIVLPPTEQCLLIVGGRLIRGRNHHGQAQAKRYQEALKLVEIDEHD